MAKQAIEAGADIINDVSGGVFDINMIPLAHAMSVPMIYMHSRGTPLTMTQPTHTTYTDIVDEISTELSNQLHKAEMLGIPRWMQIVDPGIGFAKTLSGNMSLLDPTNLRRFRQKLNDRMIMVGLSRKKFIQTVLQQSRESDPVSSSYSSAAVAAESYSFQVAEQRDFGTIGGCLAALLSTSSKSDESTEPGPTLQQQQQQQQQQCHSLPVESSVILRVHNVKAIREAVDVFTQVRWPNSS